MAKWKPVDIPLPGKIVNQNQFHIFGGIAEISATIKDLKAVGVVVYTASLSNFPMWPVQKKGVMENDSWLNQRWKEECLHLLSSLVANQENFCFLLQSS